MNIKRDVYLNKLIEREHNGLIKIVTGVRRCGKSYLLCTLFHEYLVSKGVKESHIIEIALDDRRNKDLRDPDNMLAYTDSKVLDSDIHYIILDEVQLLDEFVDVLNSLLHMKNVDVYVTGSNSKFLSTDVITEFRGRGDEVRVYPLSFSEFITGYEGNMDAAWFDYLTYGGLPLILSRKTVESKQEYLHALFDELYLTDLLERHSIRNKEEFGELIDILSSSVGSLTNPLKLSRTFKSIKNKTISVNTLVLYIDYLQEAFLISKAVRYDIKGRKYIGSPAKYYFEDIGLRNARLNFRQVEENHLMENIIYNELRYRGFCVDVGIVAVYSKDNDKSKKKQYEVDFVANKGNQRFYIQSAFAMNTPEKIEQEQNSLKHIPDSFKKIIIVREYRPPLIDENGFITIGIQQFLLNPNILS